MWAHTKRWSTWFGATVSVVIASSTTDGCNMVWVIIFIIPSTVNRSSLDVQQTEGKHPLDLHHHTKTLRRQTTALGKPSHRLRRICVCWKMPKDAKNYMRETKPLWNNLQAGNRKHPRRIAAIFYNTSESCLIFLVPMHRPIHFVHALNFAN